MTDTLLKTSPDTPSVSGDGVSLILSDGKSYELRFTAKTIIRVENIWGSHENFLLALETAPVSTLASLVVIAEHAKKDEDAIALMEGVNWRTMREAVDKAWRRANWMPEETTAEVPTTGL